MAKNVLLIEYEQRDRSRVRSLFAAPEFSVTETRDGDEGLAAFAGSKFDVVILSGKLPRHSSSDLIREIRNKGGLEAPPIVLLAANYTGSNTTADAQQVGAFEIVSKPFHDEALLSAVRSALDSTDRGAKTMKLPTASRLTSTDIFSDLLDELGREPGAAPDMIAPQAKQVPPPARTAPTASIDANLARRLQDTLSGVRSAARPGSAASTPATRSTDDIDRMLTETLRIRIPKKGPPEAAPPDADRTPTASRRAEPREAVAPEGPERFGQYELLERVASGGMAELFRARRTGVEGFQKIVAIKKILPHIADNDEFITMFADEAKLAAQLNHPNIVHIYDLGKIQAGGYFIAMEYVEGTDLRTLLRAGREKSLPLPVPLAVYVASKVASALDYAHRRRDAHGEELHIVHRDVSPQNILISHEGEIKLCDFGIAKADRKVSRTENGSLKGKLQYMSPEQAWGKPIDHRSDLFSLGSVLHEMLTGERLFRGDSDMVVLEQVRKAEISPPSRVNPDVSQALDAIVLRALAREPGERYASGSEMLRDLESVLYSYTPAPGSADLAIYLNRLQEAGAPARPGVEPEPAPVPAARKAKASPPPPPPAPAPAVRKAKAPPPPAPVPVAPAPVASAEISGAESPVQGGVFGSFLASRTESEKKRTPLYIGIAAAVVVGGILALVLTRRSPEGAQAAEASPVATAVPIASDPSAVAPPLVPTAPAPALDARGIQQEVQRQLAQKRQEMNAAPGRPTPLSRQAARAATAAAVAAAEAEVARAEPTAAPVPTAPPPEPTQVAVVVEPPAREPAQEEVAAAREDPTPAPPREAAPPPAPREPEVSRGDLVGPGPGVVEPALVAPPRVPYPPIARQQRVAGRVVVLVLVSEGGSVQEARLQKGIGGRSGIDGVVVEAVRGARFRPATKNGVPVKMWRTVVVDVRP